MVATGFGCEPYLMQRLLQIDDDLASTRKSSVTMPPTRWLSTSASVASLIRSQLRSTASSRASRTVHEFKGQSLQFRDVDRSQNSSQGSVPLRGHRRPGWLWPEGAAVPASAAPWRIGPGALSCQAIPDTPATETQSTRSTLP